MDKDTLAKLQAEIADHVRQLRAVHEGLRQLETIGRKLTELETQLEGNDDSH